MSRDLRKVLIIDIESTCWKSEDLKPAGEVHEIIELGCVLLDVKTKQILKTRSILVKPQHSKVSHFCTELTTITQDLLDQEGVSFQEAMETLRSEFKPRDITWASYGDYDRIQIEKNCELYQVKNQLGRTHINIKNLFALKNNLTKEVGMEGALKILGEILEGQHHRGLADAINISKILIKTLW